MLIKYIRSPRKYSAKVVYVDGCPVAKLKIAGNDPIGVVVSPRRGVVGWSMCSPKDKFDKNLALMIAMNRADHFGADRNEMVKEVPADIIDDVNIMYKRSERFYK